eukprot:TRINITY_DN11454_c0_g1_i2.p1 TRINITY_DN11454_c0_g1~~TRINITY_DN11454_c0_g1_i2.p1  ORF type:complete len:511 (-),score=64.55 TRINITY_DN11454_c0_g1_i2:136-1668(-)
MTERFHCRSEHLEHLQASKNRVLVKDTIGRTQERCNDVDSTLVHGHPTPLDPVCAGEMIWPPYERAPAPRPSRKSSAGTRASSGRERPSVFGKENRPSSPLSGVIKNHFGQDQEAVTAYNYKLYAVEKEKQRQPLRFKMTGAVRAKIERAREKPQVPDIKDRWLMKKFQNVPSHFEQDRRKCMGSSSAPDLKKVASQDQVVKNEDRSVAGSAPTLNWPAPQYPHEAHLIKSRSSATPSTAASSTQISQEAHKHLEGASKVGESRVSASAPFTVNSANQPPLGQGSSLSIAVPETDERRSALLGSHLSASAPLASRVSASAPLADLALPDRAPPLPGSRSRCSSANALGRCASGNIGAPADVQALPGSANRAAAMPHRPASAGACGASALTQMRRQLMAAGPGGAPLPQREEVHEASAAAPRSRPISSRPPVARPPIAQTAGPQSAIVAGSAQEARPPRAALELPQAGELSALEEVCSPLRAKLVRALSASRTRARARSAGPKKCRSCICW